MPLYNLSAGSAVPAQIQNLTLKAKGSRINKVASVAEEWARLYLNTIPRSSKVSNPKLRTRCALRVSAFPRRGVTASGLVGGRQSMLGSHTHQVRLMILSADLITITQEGEAVLSPKLSTSWAMDDAILVSRRRAVARVTRRALIWCLWSKDLPTPTYLCAGQCSN